MSVLRRCFAVRFGKLRFAGLLCLLLVTCAVLVVLPGFAAALVCSGDDCGLCQAPDPLGDPLNVVTFLDLYHGCALGVDPFLLAPACGFAAPCSGGPTPQDLAWTVALVGRPPPLGA